VRGETGNKRGDQRRPSRPRWSFGLLSVLGAVLYLAVELLTLRSPASLILGTVFAVSVAGTGLMLAFPERIPLAWERSIHGRPSLAAGLILLAMVALTALLVADLVALYDR
jgi:anti-sigma factor RsiW